VRSVLRWDESTVGAGGDRLHLRRLVGAPAPPILLLHGLGVTGAAWQSFARRLAPGYAAVAPDLRGHGGSVVRQAHHERDAQAHHERDAQAHHERDAQAHHERDAQAHHEPAAGYQPADYAADLAELWPAVLNGPVPVVGHSLGALVALALAAARPELVTAVVLLDPPVDPNRRNEDIATVRRLKHEPPGVLEEYLASTSLGGNALVARALAEQFRQASDAAFDAMLAAPAGHPGSLAVAASLTQPVLVVQADPEHGGVLGDDAARRFAGLMARSRLHKLVGAPHAVHASHPRQVADLILQFLANPPS